MKSIYYSVPVTLLREKELVEAKCEIIIEAFNQLCSEEEKRLRVAKYEALKARKFEYSVMSIKDGWTVLFKMATNPIEGQDDNDQWSRPFKIINGVLVFADWTHKSKSWMTANAALGEQRIVGDTFDPGKITGW